MAKIVNVILILAQGYAYFFKLQLNLMLRAMLSTLTENFTTLQKLGTNCQQKGQLQEFQLSSDAQLMLIFGPFLAQAMLINVIYPMLIKKTCIIIVQHFGEQQSCKRSPIGMMRLKFGKTQHQCISIIILQAISQ